MARDGRVIWSLQLGMDANHKPSILFVYFTYTKSLASRLGLARKGGQPLS
jgi:hypothetical protein